MKKTDDKFIRNTRFDALGRHAYGYDYKNFSVKVYEMAITTLKNSPLRNTQAWNQMVMDSLVQSGVWGGMMRKVVNGSSGLEAISGGKTYSDAMVNSLRAQAKNYAESGRSLGDAASLLKTAGNALSDLNGIVEKMGYLAAEYQRNPNAAATRARTAAEFNSLAGQADALIKNSTYKNITVLDGSNRSSEGLVSNRNLSVQIGSGEFKLNLHDFSGTMDFSSNNVESLKTLDNIREMVKTMEMYHNSYLRQADSFAKASQDFSSAAGMLNSAVSNRTGFWQDMSTDGVARSLINRGTGTISNSTA